MFLEIVNISNGNILMTEILPPIAIFHPAIEDIPFKSQPPLRSIQRPSLTKDTRTRPAGSKFGLIFISTISTGHGLSALLLAQSQPVRPPALLNYFAVLIKSN